MKEHERYIIDEREVQLLDRYEGTMAQSKDPHRYDTFDAESLAMFCRMKDRGIDMWCRRCQAAKDVIDLIAEEVGINPNKTDFWLYTTDADGGSPILNRIQGWVSRSGEKAQLKKRVQELETENAVLKSLLVK